MPMTSALSRPVRLRDLAGSGVAAWGRREPAIETQSQATLGSDRSLQPALGQGQIDVFILVETEEPVPHIPQGNLRDLSDPRVLNESRGLALGVQDRLEDHPLGTEELRHLIALLDDKARSLALLPVQSLVYQGET